MKKSIITLTALLLILTCLGGCSKEEQKPVDGKETDNTVETKTAGVLWYQFADTFIANAKNNLENISKADGRIEVVSADSQNDIANQTNNMNNFFTQGKDFIVVNNINTAATDEIAEQIVNAGSTAIFANTTAPSDEVLAKDGVYLVTSAAEQSGTIMGEALVKYWNEHPEADRNGNGKLDCVVLLGLESHYDTIVRDSGSREALEAAGIEQVLVGGSKIVANYQRAEAQDKVTALLANFSDDIEAVIACNDDMALGAIEALKAGGFFTGDESTFIPVCGVDATEPGRQAVKDGTMLVTALNDPVKLGKSIYKLMVLVSEGTPLTQENLGIEGTTVDGSKVWINYVGVTAENVDTIGYDINDTNLK